jgi:hypothetical protein
MSTISPVLQAFFDQYERSRNSWDVELFASQYPDSWMYAGPDGPRVADKQTLLAGLPKGQELLKTIGHTSTKLVSLSETRLDEEYAMVRALFVWRFERAPPQPIDVEVDSTFIVHIKDGVPKIVFQHEHEEFLQALQARGVLPRDWNPAR